MKPTIWGVAPITVALTAAFILSGCSATLQSYVVKAKTVISNALENPESTLVDQPPFDSPA